MAKQNLGETTEARPLSKEEESRKAGPDIIPAHLTSETPASPFAKLGVLRGVGAAANREFIVNNEDQKAVSEPSMETGELPKANDLFAGYKGKAKLEKYLKPISEMLSQSRVPSQEDIKNMLPGGPAGKKLAEAIDENYPSWAEKFKKTESPVMADNQVLENELDKRKKDLQAKYGDVFQKFLYQEGSKHWIKVAECDLLVPKFRVISSVVNLNQRWITPEELDELLMTYSQKEKKGKLSLGEAPKEPEKSVDKTPKDYSKVGQKSVELTRGAADITLDLMSEEDFISMFREVEGKTVGKSEKEVHEIFLEKTKELWKLFAVHGSDIKKDPETGKFVANRYPDLDGKTTLWLLALAGINRENLLIAAEGDPRKRGKDVEYLVPGEFSEGRINIDTSNQEGVEIVRDEEGKVRYYSIDHHHLERSKMGSSAAQYAYEMLTNLGLLEKKPHLERMVQFVSDVDNGIYSEEFFKEYFKKSWNTIAGLAYFVKPAELASFFGKNTNPDVNRELSASELREYNLIWGNGKTGSNNKSLYREKFVKAAEKALPEMEKEGFIIDSTRYGRIAVNVQGRFQVDFLAARAFGCDGFVSWNAENGGFMISSKTPIEDEFSNGRRVREIMWLKPYKDESPLTITLREVLEKMTDGKLNPTGKLKEYLDKEAGINAPAFNASAEKEMMRKGEWRSDEEELLEQLGGKRPVLRETAGAETKTEIEKEVLNSEQKDVFVRWGKELRAQLKGIYEGYSPEDKEVMLRVDLKYFLRSELEKSKLIESGEQTREEVARIIDLVFGA